MKKITAAVVLGAPDGSDRLLFVEPRLWTLPTADTADGQDTIDAAEAMVDATWHDAPVHVYEDEEQVCLVYYGKARSWNHTGLFKWMDCHEALHCHKLTPLCHSALVRLYGSLSYLRCKIQETEST